MEKIFTKNLICNIIVCGTSSEGESIIVLLKSDDKTFTIVVDSFSVDQKVVPLEVLKSKGIKKIDYLIWTHPHSDHTIGMDDVLDIDIEYILIPPKLDSFIKKFGEYYKKTYKKIETIAAKGCNNAMTHWTKVCEVNLSSRFPICEFIINTFASCETELIAFSPDSQRLINTYKKNSQQINDLSVGMDLVIGDFVVSLASDVENNSIGYALENGRGIGFYPNIIKIPHHCSSSSNQILSLYSKNEKDSINLKSLIGITTAKKSSGLPDEKLLSDYNNSWNEIYKIDPKSSGLSIIEFQIDIGAATIEVVNNTNFVKA